MLDSEPISGMLGVKLEYTLDGMTVQCREPCTHSHTLIHTQGEN